MLQMILCSLEHSKVCFGLLKILRAAQNALSLQETGFPPKSEILSNQRCHFYSFEWSELSFIHSFANSVSLYFVSDDWAVQDTLVQLHHLPTQEENNFSGMMYDV